MRIVLTGGPCAGKTTVANAISQRLSQKIALVPEAATLLFSGGFPRCEKKQSRIHRQRAIYFVQKELESTVAQLNPGKALLLDRASLDSSAYWPEDASTSFFESVGTTKKRELNRFDAIIHLDSVSKELYCGTEIRTDGYEQSQRLNEKIKLAWQDHKCRWIVPCFQDFEEKLKATILLVEKILQMPSPTRFSRDSLMLNQSIH